MDLSIKNLQNVDQTKGNVLTNATKHKETVVHKRFRQIFVFGCKKTDRQQQKGGSKEEDRQERAEEDIFCRNRLYAIVSLCFVALVSTFPEISSILSASPAVVYSFVQNIVAELF